MYIYLFICLLISNYFIYFLDTQIVVDINLIFAENSKNTLKLQNLINKNIEYRYLYTKLACSNSFVVFTENPYLFLLDKDSNCYSTNNGHSEYIQFTKG